MDMNKTFAELSQVETVGKFATNNWLLSGLRFQMNYDEELEA
jgi:hypothetical protein